MESSLARIIGRGPVHFVGIGGISMSGLAKILLHRGIPVTGSDWQESDAVEQLRQFGAAVCVPHKGACIGGQTTLVVHTAAIPKDNPELLEAARLGIPVMNRGAFLGDLAAGYRDTAAVAGTHGKTTSTGMLATVMIAAGLDPTVHIGGILPAIGGNTRLGGPDHFVMEACEYKNSFLDFHPNRALILNIEADHLDFFQDLADILNSFALFSKNLPAEGSLVMNLDDAGCRNLCGHLRRPYTGYSLDLRETAKSAFLEAEAVYTGSDLTFQEGKAKFDILLNGRRLARIGLSVPGRHNASNAIGCFALCHRMGMDPGVIAEGLSLFTGTGRRFERKGTIKGAVLIDDYAHHPTEIAATFETARKMTSGRILCIFQPHTYTRTLELYEDFAQVLAKADVVLLLDIYAAREPDLGLVHARSLAGRIGEIGGHATYLPSFHDAAVRMAELAQEGDIIFTMGAGDVFRAGEELLALTGRNH